MPGTTMPEPSPLVHVTAQARPSPSSTEMCVVEPSCEAMNSSRKPGRSRPSTNSGVRARCASSIAASSRPWLGGAGLAVELGEHGGDQDPAGRRRRVGEDVEAAVADADRLARDRLVAREVRLGQRAAARGHPLARRARDVTGVERRRPLRAEPLERVGELGVGEHVALARHAVADPVLRARLRRARGDRLEQGEDVGLLRVELDARARERGAGRDEVGERERREAAVRLADPRRRPVGAARRRADVEDLGGGLEEHLGRDERRARRRCRRPRRAPRRRSRAARAPRPARPRACTRPPRARSAAARSTNEATIAASAASTALPPARRICAPASAVSGWPAATTPLTGRDTRAKRPRTAG